MGPELGLDNKLYKSDHQGQDGKQHLAVLLCDLHCPGHHSSLLLLRLQHHLKKGNVLLALKERHVPEGAVLPLALMLHVLGMPGP